MEENDIPCSQPDADSVVLIQSIKKELERRMRILPSAENTTEYAQCTQQIRDLFLQLQAMHVTVGTLRITKIGKLMTKLQNQLPRDLAAIATNINDRWKEILHAYRQELKRSLSEGQSKMRNTPPDTKPGRSNNSWNFDSISRDPSLQIQASEIKRASEYLKSSGSASHHQQPKENSNLTSKSAPNLHTNPRTTKTQTSLTPTPHYTTTPSANTKKPSCEIATTSSPGPSTKNMRSSPVLSTTSKAHKQNSDVFAVPLAVSNNQKQTRTQLQSVAVAVNSSPDTTHEIPPVLLRANERPNQVYSSTTQFASKPVGASQEFQERQNQTSGSNITNSQQSSIPHDQSMSPRLISSDVVETSRQNVAGFTKTFHKMLDSNVSCIISVQKQCVGMLESMQHMKDRLATFESQMVTRLDAMTSHQTDTIVGETTPSPQQLRDDGLVTSSRKRITPNREFSDDEGRFRKPKPMVSSAPHQNRNIAFDEQSSQMFPQRFVRSKSSASETRYHRTVDYANLPNKSNCSGDERMRRTSSSSSDYEEHVISSSAYTSSDDTLSYDSSESTSTTTRPVNLPTALGQTKSNLEFVLSSIVVPPKRKNSAVRTHNGSPVTKKKSLTHSSSQPSKISEFAHNDVDSRNQSARTQQLRETPPLRPPFTQNHENKNNNKREVGQNHTSNRRPDNNVVPRGSPLEPMIPAHQIKTELLTNSQNIKKEIQGDQVLENGEPVTFSISNNQRWEQACPSVDERINMTPDNTPDQSGGSGGRNALPRGDAPTTSQNNNNNNNNIDQDGFQIPTRIISQTVIKTDSKTLIRRQKERGHQASSSNDDVTTASGGDGDEFLSFSQQVVDMGDEIDDSDKDYLLTDISKKRKNWNSICKNKQGLQYAPLMKSNGRMKAAHVRPVGKEALHKMLDRKKRDEDISKLFEDDEDISWEI